MPTFFHVADETIPNNSNILALIVPYVHGHDSPNLPRFKVGGDVAAAYFEAAEKIWDEAEPWVLSDSTQNGCDKAP